MTDRAHVFLFTVVTIGLLVIAAWAIFRGDVATAGGALAVLAALYVPPPPKPKARFGALTAFLAAVGWLSVPACSSSYDFRLLGFRSSSIEMTPQAANPIPAGVGGIYTKASDNKPRFVDAAGIEYPAGEARRFFTFTGNPPGATVGDCWVSNADGKFYCQEYQGAMRQRFDGLNPGPIGCGGTQNVGCFSSVTIKGAAVEVFFSRTCTITSAAGLTPVQCLADADVPSGASAHVMGFHGFVSGSTPWTVSTTCTLSDTNGVQFAGFGSTVLTGNAYFNDATSAVARYDALRKNLGGTDHRGLRLSCDSNGAGSDLVVTVFGAIK